MAHETTWPPVDGVQARQSPAARPRAAATRPDHPGTDDKLEELREILFGEERDRIARLDRRLCDPEQRTSDLAEVLPAVVRVADKRLADALETPLARSLRRSVEEDPGHLAQALSPVIGPAIRRSLCETLKGLVRSINRAVAHTISPRGIRWHIEARRSGIPFAEVVLKSTLLYRVDAAYLIHNPSGLLIDQAVTATEKRLADEATVSAILDAIQGTVQDTSDHAEDSPAPIEIDGRTLWVLRGPRATLACLISGQPPHQLRRRLDAILFEIHAALGATLADFDGDNAPIAALHPLLDDALTLEYRPGSGAEGPITWWPWVLLAVLAAASAGWLGWREHLWGQRLEQARQRLASTPGIVLLDWDPGRRVHASILADPLAEDPVQRIADPQVARQLDLTRRPYVSADPPIVLARARHQLAPPGGVALGYEDGVLSINGSASPEWVDRVSGTTVLPPGVDALDLSALASDRSDLMARVRAAITPPDGVELALHGTDLTISGTAPRDWIGDLRARLAGVEGLDGCDDSGLKTTELAETQTLIETLAGLEVLFGDAVNPLPGSTETIAKAAELLDRLIVLDRSEDLGLGITVMGHSDGVGDQRWNQWLRQQRSDYVAQLLVERGIPRARLSTVPIAGYEPSAVPRPEERWVRIRAEVHPPERSGCGGD